MKAYPIDDQPSPHGHNRMVPCPGCGGPMKDTSSLCIQCEAEARGQRMHERWLEQHDAEMMPRHRRVKQIMADTGLSPLEALQQARREWGETDGA